MSNNIYDILKKIQHLETPKTALTESKKVKPDYIDIDKDGDKKEPMKKAVKDKTKGGMAEAVARVEQQLSEKYTGFKKLDEETEQFRNIKQGAKDFGMGVADLAQGLATMATGGKVRSIDQQRADAQRREQMAIDRAAKEAGSEVGDRYHRQLIKTNPAYRDEYMSQVRDVRSPEVRRQIEKELQAKHDPMGGPMEESAVEESGLQAYLGKKKYGETGMKALQQAGREGASKEKMALLRAKHDKMDEAVDQEGPADLLAAVEQEINNPGRGVDNLTDVLNATFGSDRSPEFKKARAVIGKYLDLVDNAAMGSEQDGIAPMQGGNIARHIQQYDLTDYLQHAAAMLDKAVKGPLGEGNYNEDMLSAKEKSFAALAEPKDKITYADKIAGAKKGKKTEGNKFSGNLMKARAQGLKKADLDGDGDMEPVREETGEERDLSARRENERYDSARNYQGRNARGDVIRSGGEVVRANPNPPSMIQRLAGKLDLPNTAKDALGDPMYKSSRPAGGGGGGGRAGGMGGHITDPSAVKSLIPNFESKTPMREGWEEMQKYLDKKRGPESKGGAGKKAGTRYGGSAQKDDDEDTDGEGKPVEKKRGRPKGTGGGAKFNFKKSKD